MPAPSPRVRPSRGPALFALPPRALRALPAGALASLLAACAAAPPPARRAAPRPPAPPPAASAPPAVSAAPPEAGPPPIDLDLAARYFDEAGAACRADGGRLWGHSLCGPLLFAGAASHFVVANAPDAQGALAPRGRVFVGTLPPAQNVANTALAWSGVRWTMVSWAPPDDAEPRLVLLMHESFHALEPKLGVREDGPSNDHLASAEGRRLLRLEWRALAAALAAAGPARARAAADALAFRAERRRLFPDAAPAERALETHEGLAEYTGVRLAGRDAEDRVRLARARLADAEGKASFVRSFAYGSGPAYGVLLDEAGGAWRPRAAAGDDLGELLARALAVRPAAVGARARAGAYGGAAILREEAAREAEDRKRVAALRALVIEGPTLALPKQEGLSAVFNPNQVMPMGEAGTGYPTLRVTDAWGELVVSAGGALLDQAWSKVTVSAPEDPAARPLQGKGWVLRLNPGWSLAPGARRGDYVLRKAAP